MISIIIPSYNQAEYLPEAIESALNQTKQAEEILVVDDGSTDNSLEIAKKYHIKVISQVNKGLASARNTGIMNSHSQDWGGFHYLLFLDADDVLLENCLEKIWDTAQKNLAAEIVAPSFQTFGTTSYEVTLMAEPKLEDFRGGNRLGYCAAIRKSALLEVGGYNPKMVEGYEDLALWCLLLSKGKKVVTIPEVLWRYRTKLESMYTKITPDVHKKLITQINKDVPEAQLNF